MLILLPVGDADTNAGFDADANADVNANAYASQLLTPPTRPMLSPTLSLQKNGKVEIVKVHECPMFFDYRIRFE